MTDDLTRYLATRPATADRPLLGLTVLLVEDSRFASEAMRLLCLRSGARIRRADCLRTAYRHLQTYRPGIVIVDMGLPDGSGAELIRAVKAMQAPQPAVLCLSGDPTTEVAARAAGADDFIEKPLESLAFFQQRVLALLPADERPRGLHPLRDERIAPDPLALRDDLSQAAEVLAARPDRAATEYVAQFLSGIARASHDTALASAAGEYGRAPAPAALSRLNGIVQARLAAAARF